LKAINALNEAYHARCINYLKASGPCPGLLLNFDMNWLEIDRVANTV
jgi:GxxExxY protein